MCFIDFIDSGKTRFHFEGNKIQKENIDKATRDSWEKEEEEKKGREAIRRRNSVVK